MSRYHRIAGDLSATVLATAMLVIYVSPGGTVSPLIKHFDTERAAGPGSILEGHPYCIQSLVQWMGDPVQVIYNLWNWTVVLTISRAKQAKKKLTVSTVPWKQ